MGLSQIKNGIFSVKPLKDKKGEVKTTPKPSEKEKITYSDYGFLQAGKLGGTFPGLKVCLQKLYHDFNQDIRNDNVKQDELKKPYKIKIEEYKGDNERIEKKIAKVKTDYLVRAIKKIELLKEELSHIKKNPQEITGDDAGKASFLIGGIILLFLTIYLFVFYSSASYSAFFKEFSLNEIGVANSIFDAQALSKALTDGVTELTLILTIPFVFLGLGYLIHKFQEQKGFIKYIKITILILITFIFDSILAFEITEKIYNIKKDNSFQDMDDYTYSFAFQSTNFWLIIFAGFIVYLIWGFVFDFVMESYAKTDKIKMAIQEKEKQIKDAEAEHKDLEEQVDKMTHTIDANNTEISKLSSILESSIIPREFEHDIFSFLTGWMSWMKQSGRSHTDLDEADRITREFVEATINRFEFKNTN